MSVAARPRPSLSTASSIDETIYTPPYSPASSFHQNQVVGEELENASASPSTSSAAAYFSSRPARGSTPASSTPETYSITITSTTEPKNLQYPVALQAKDINQQDWATFVNYLIPDHIATANNDIADRKLNAELKAETERLQKFTLGPEELSSNRSNADELEAQLSPLRQSQASPPTARLNEVKATVTEWNNGFFEPRGVKVVLVDEADRVNQMPGAWIPWENEISPEGSRNAVPETRRSWGPFGFRADAEGFRLGSMVADNGGFRIGKMLVAE